MLIERKFQGTYVNLIGRLILQGIVTTICQVLDHLALMASGLPVVTVNAGGPTDFIHHNETGLLVEPDNKTAFLAGVKQLLHDKILRKKMGAAAHAHAETMTWSAVGDALLQEFPMSGALTKMNENL